MIGEILFYLVVSPVLFHQDHATKLFSEPLTAIECRDRAIQLTKRNPNSVYACWSVGSVEQILKERK